MIIFNVYFTITRICFFSLSFIDSLALMFCDVEDIFPSINAGELTDMVKSTFCGLSCLFRILVHTTAF